MCTHKRAHTHLDGEDVQKFFEFEPSEHTRRAKSSRLFAQSAHETAVDGRQARHQRFDLLAPHAIRAFQIEGGEHVAVDGDGFAAWVDAQHARTPLQPPLTHTLLIVLRLTHTHKHSYSGRVSVR